MSRIDDQIITSSTASYEAPTLTVLGSVAELTQQNVNPNADELLNEGSRL